ncbi:uncharacterized protein LOC120347410 isoform X2 [Styela clava]
MTILSREETVMDIPVKLAVLYMVFYSCRGAQFPDIKVLENCPYDGLPRCQFVSKIALNPGAFCPNDPPYPPVDAVDEECATKCYIPAPRGPAHCNFLESYECKRSIASALQAIAKRKHDIQLRSGSIKIILF